MYTSAKELSNDNLKTGSFTTVEGENTISIGFVPRKLYILRDDVPTLISYQRDWNTNYYIYQAGTTKNTFKVEIGTGYYYWTVYNEKLNGSYYSETISTTPLGTYLKSVGTNSVMVTGAADKLFYWIAFK